MFTPLGSPGVAATSRRQPPSSTLSAAKLVSKFARRELEARDRSTGLPSLNP
jgi:hypothetical protein